MITNNYLVNKVFCGLARLFITEHRLDFPAEITPDELKNIELNERRLTECIATSTMAMYNAKVEADKQSFTKQAVEALLKSTRTANLSPIHWADDSWIVEQRGHYAIKLGLFELKIAQDLTCACLSVTETETNTLLIEACYWQPNDGTPMLTASAYLHPRVHHLTIPEGIRLGLIQADRNYGGYAIQNLCDWWEAKHGQ